MARVYLFISDVFVDFAKLFVGIYAVRQAEFCVKMARRFTDKARLLVVGYTRTY